MTRWPLSRKIGILAVFNVALLGATLLGSIWWQFRLRAESILLGSAHDRIFGVATAFNREFQAASGANREDLLASYSKRYGAEFLLTDAFGSWMGGPKRELPPEVRAEIQRTAPPEWGPGLTAPMEGGPARSALPPPPPPRNHSKAPSKDNPGPASGTHKGVDTADARPPQSGLDAAEAKPPRKGPGPPPPRPPQKGIDTADARPPQSEHDAADAKPLRKAPGPPPPRPPQKGIDTADARTPQNEPVAAEAKPLRKEPGPSTPESSPKGLDAADARLPQKGPHIPAPKEGRPRRRELEGQPAFVLITQNPTTYWGGARISLHRPESASSGILIFHTRSPFNRFLLLDWRSWLIVALICATVSSLCWLPFLRSLTRSIVRAGEATEQIARGRLDVQVPAARRDEVGELAAQINRLGSHLQSFVRNQKRFVGDIAHELSAPIARIQFAIGALESRLDESAQPNLIELDEEIQEMSKLVNELLSFSKAGLAADAAPLSAVSVASVARRAVQREALAEQAIELQVPADLSVNANETLLVRALGNVIRNAIRYAGESGPITVAARREGGEAAITVADCGPGLPEKELAEVFAPFYRPEASRSRELGGAGLGLAIVRACVEACKGTVVCSNRQPVGLEVTIRLATAESAPA